jgi:putative sterol carrier protein
VADTDLTDIDMTNFDSVDPKQFAQFVKRASNDELAAFVAGDNRAKVIGEIVRRMPTLFRADRAGHTNAVVHWHIGGAPDDAVDAYELVIADGKCTLSQAMEHEPNLALTLSAVDFLKMVSGNGNPVMMFMTGKLKAKGDLGLAAKIADLFDMPKA